MSSLWLCSEHIRPLFFFVAALVTWGSAITTVLYALRNVFLYMAIPVPGNGVDELSLLAFDRRVQRHTESYTHPRYRVCMIAAHEKSNEP